MTQPWEPSWRPGRAPVRSDESTDEDKTVFVNSDEQTSVEARKGALHLWHRKGTKIGTARSQFPRAESFRGLQIRQTTCVSLATARKLGQSDKSSEPIFAFPWLRRSAFSISMPTPELEQRPRTASPGDS